MNDSSPQSDFRGIILYKNLLIKIEKHRIPSATNINLTLTNTTL